MCSRTPSRLRLTYSRRAKLRSGASARCADMPRMEIACMSMICEQNACLCHTSSPMIASKILPMMRRHSAQQSVRRLSVRKRRLPPEVPPLKRSIRHRFTQSSQVVAVFLPPEKQRWRCQIPQHWNCMPEHSALPIMRRGHHHSATDDLRGLDKKQPSTLTCDPPELSNFAGPDSAASFLLPPSEVPARAASQYVEQMVVERQAREQAAARLRAGYGGGYRGGGPGDYPPPQRSAAHVAPCFYYQRGTCEWGDKCRYSHDVPQLSPRVGGGGQPGSSDSGRSAEQLAGARRPASAAAGGGATAAAPVKRADGLTPQQLACIRAAAGGHDVSGNTQDPYLGAAYWMSLGKRPEELPFYKTVIVSQASFVGPFGVEHGLGSLLGLVPSRLLNWPRAALACTVSQYLTRWIAADYI